MSAWSRFRHGQEERERVRTRTFLARYLHGVSLGEIAQLTRSEIRAYVEELSDLFRRESGTATHFENSGVY